MSATDVIVVLLCAAMILAGIAMIRLSREQRGTGAIAIVLGVIGLLAYLTAEQGSPPPPNATPTHGLMATAIPTSDAP
jgi:lipopolysaccharide export LptBFGC system permease protein LptF